MENLLKSLPKKDARESTFFDQKLLIFGRFFGHFGSMLGPRREKTLKNTLLESKRKKDEKQHEKPRKRDPTRGAQAITTWASGGTESAKQKKADKKRYKANQTEKQDEKSLRAAEDEHKQAKQKARVAKAFFPKFGPRMSPKSPKISLKSSQMRPKIALWSLLGPSWAHLGPPRGEKQKFWGAKALHRRFWPPTWDPKKNPKPTKVLKFGPQDAIF